MDHRAFLSSLPAATKAGLTERSDRAGLWHLAGHFGLIVGVGALIAARVPLWPLLLPLQGVLIVFLFTLEHECTHKTPFASMRLNEVVGRLCGVLLLLPFGWFRYFHLAHHRHTNVPGLDPELAAPKPDTPGQWLLHVSGLSYWRAGLLLLGRLAVGRERAEFLPVAALPRLMRGARWMCAVYIVALASLIVSPALLWLWLVPVLLGQPVLRLYLLAEHGDCHYVANMFENTRTVFTTALVRFLAWNMPYHVEHHVMPAVPFHRLPELHGLMRAELRVTAAGYVEFSRGYLARRL